MTAAQKMSPGVVSSSSGQIGRVIRREGTPQRDGRHGRHGRSFNQPRLVLADRPDRDEAELLVETLPFSRCIQHQRTWA